MTNEALAPFKRIHPKFEVCNRTGPKSNYVYVRSVSGEACTKEQYVSQEQLVAPAPNGEIVLNLIDTDVDTTTTTYLVFEECYKTVILGAPASSSEASATESTTDTSTADSSADTTTDTTADATAEGEQ